MKKILFLMIMILGVAVGYSQNQTVDKVVGYDDTYVLYDGIASDTIGIADSTWTYTVRKKNDTRLRPYVYLDIDSVSGTPNVVNCILQGKTTPDESYTDITTVAWTNGNDTTIAYDVTAVKPYEYWRVSIEGQADEFKAEVQVLNFKFLK